MNEEVNLLAHCLDGVERCPISESHHGSVVTRGIKYAIWEHEQCPWGG